MHFNRGNPKQWLLIKGHLMVNASTFEQQGPKEIFLL